MKQEDQEPEEKLTDDVAPHSAPVTVDELVALKEELQSIREEHEQVKNQFKRALADYQNLEKRVQESRAELAAWASAEVIKKILPVMDHFDKALGGASEEETKSGWFKGVKMSVLQLQQMLKDEGLEQIETDGQFDPTLHEAVDTKEGKDGQVLEVVEKGWMLNGKIMKPARVVVGKKIKNGY
jgi:molecular chaperone GrpE